ncbi:hypothetical protein JCM33374_g704 [Metschnikowia sp. JCM 33374]|nr:hypothetical protein JCM33374_g704 [Metschnikowia sp. JCM 33374]
MRLESPNIVARDHVTGDLLRWVRTPSPTPLMRNTATTTPLYGRIMNSTSQFGKNPLNKIMGLSVVLSVGFLLVVLAGIAGNWFPIVDGIIFGIAYLPVIISRVVFNSSDYDFNFDPQTTSQTSAVKESGKFITAALLVTGLYLPILLHHSNLLTTTAVILTLVGGILIFGTVYTFSQAFDSPEEAEEGFGVGVI